MGIYQKQGVLSGQKNDKIGVISYKYKRRFEVSRATVREAVRAMEVRGFVKRLHGKGIVVVDNSISAMCIDVGD